MDFYEDIKERFFNLIKDKNLMSLKVQIVSARPLTPQEVIGKPERNDFPLLKGKEVMIQANFKGSLGQAFTDNILVARTLGASDLKILVTIVAPLALPNIFTGLRLESGMAWRVIIAALNMFVKMLI